MMSLFCSNTLSIRLLELVEETLFLSIRLLELVDLMICEISTSVLPLEF